MAPRYRIVQDFVNREALGMQGAAHGNPTDPLWLKIVISTADPTKLAVDSTFRGTPPGLAKRDAIVHTHGEPQQAIIEEAESGIPNRMNLWRLRTGTWAFTLDAARYKPGQLYVATWRFQMTPGNDNVVRQLFTWNAVPEMPHDPDTVIVYGLLADITGNPLPQRRIVVEQYSDIATLNTRVHSADVLTDIFGLWWIELKQGSVYRFILDDLSKVARTPKRGGRVPLSSLTAYQPTDIVRTDRFGYPMPGQDGLAAILQQRLADREVALILERLSSQLLARYGKDASGLQLLVHNQTAPSTTWAVQHGKNCRPIVAVLDAFGNMILPDVQYPDANNIVVNFGEPETGKVVLLTGPEEGI